MTEQEQTKQMLKILCDKFQCSAIDRSYMTKSCKQCEDIVKALHEAGYGNISEYKAEIERLKANGCRSIMDAFENNRDKIVENIQTEIDDYKQSIKQAKIDMLNEVKKCIRCDNFFPDGKWHRYVLVSDIDTLIEEVEK